MKRHGAITALGSLTIFYSGEFVTFDCRCRNERLKLSVIFHQGPKKEEEFVIQNQIEFLGNQKRKGCTDAPRAVGDNSFR